MGSKNFKTKKMTKAFRFGLVLVLMLNLIGVRAFLEPLFYDPLISYFKNDSLTKPIPDLNFSIYFFNIFFSNHWTIN